MSTYKKKKGSWRRCGRARLAPGPCAVAAPPALGTALAVGGVVVGGGIDVGGKGGAI